MPSGRPQAPRPMTAPQRATRRSSVVRSAFASAIAFRSPALAGRQTEGRGMGAAGRPGYRSVDRQSACSPRRTFRLGTSDGVSVLHCGAASRSSRSARRGHSLTARLAKATSLRLHWGSVHDGITPFVERHVLGQEFGAVSVRVARHGVDPYVNGDSSLCVLMTPSLLASVLRGTSRRCAWRRPGTVGLGRGRRTSSANTAKSAAHESDDAVGVPARSSALDDLGPGPDPFDQIRLGAAGRQLLEVRGQSRKPEDTGTALPGTLPGHVRARCEPSRRSRTTSPGGRSRCPPPTWRRRRSRSGGRVGRLETRRVEPGAAVATKKHAGELSVDSGPLQDVAERRPQFDFEHTRVSPPPR